MSGEDMRRRRLPPLSDGVFPKLDICEILWDRKRSVTPSDVKPVELLFLGPYQSSCWVDKVAEEHRRRLQSEMSKEGPWSPGDLRLRLKVCEPPFEIPGTTDGKGYWMRPVHAKSEERKKLLRKRIFTGVAQALGFIARQRSRLLVGLGQGAFITAMLGLPLVVEAACRARIVTDRELLDLRRSWAGVA